MNKRIIGWLSLGVVSVLFIILIADIHIWKYSLHALFPELKEVIYPRATLLLLLKEHLVLVIVSSFSAFTVGLMLGIFVTRSSGRQFLEIVNDISALGQTFPPVAVLALAVPSLGFGFKPTVIALFLYSILPIIRNTISGLEAIPAETVEAALGMGFTRFQTLINIEIPLALPVIISGVRISVVINIGTATIGAVVGAGGLGTPIISGLVRNNPAFILEGATAAALLAIITDQILSLTEKTLFSVYTKE